MAAPGCSGGNGGDSSSDVPFNRLAAGYAAVLCHKNVVCCDDSELGSNPNPDRAALEATCRPNFANAMAVFLEPYAPLMSAGRIIYHGDHARLCLRRDRRAALRGVGDQLSSGQVPGLSADLTRRYDRARRRVHAQRRVHRRVLQLQQRRRRLRGLPAEWRILQPRSVPAGASLLCLILRPAPPRSARPRYPTALRAIATSTAPAPSAWRTSASLPTLCNGF